MSINNEIKSLGDLVDKKQPQKKDSALDIGILKQKRDFNDDDDYFKIPAYSASLIKDYLKNPGILRSLGNKGYRRAKNSDVLKFGTIMHRIILDGDEFGYYDPIMTNKEIEIKNNILKNILTNKFIINILRDYKWREKVITWSEVIRGEKVPCKAKIDLFTKSGFLVDWKTCGALDDIKYHVDKYRYDLSMAFYVRALEQYGEKVNGVCLVGAEKVYPFDFHVFELGPRLLTRGKNGGHTNNKKYVSGWLDALEAMKFEKNKRFESAVTILN